MKHYLLILTLCTCTILNAQMNAGSNDGLELAGFRYTSIPSLGDLRIEKQTFNVGFGKKLLKGALLFGIQYESTDLIFKERVNDILLSDFDNFKKIRLNVFYRRNLKNNWSTNVMLAPMLSSNFEGQISSEDFVFSALASVSKIWKTDDTIKSTLTFGLAFGTLFGQPRIFPMANYTRRVNDELSYTIGLPRIGLFYRPDEKNKISITARPESFFANNSDNFSLNINSEYDNTKIQLNALRLGIDYDLKFGKNWITSFGLGYLPISNLSVLDDNANEIYEFDTNESISINFALKFNINKR